MRKLISLILAVLMVGLCACGIAEGTDTSAATAFLRIKEGVTAQVFENPGDGKAIDTLQAGRFCGMLGKGTTEAGTAWFHVFYLNSKKEGTTGYINAEDAEQLTENQLKALMEDPATLNEILDLIDAVNAYLSKKDGNAENGGGAQQNEVKSLYEKAMDGLKKLFGTSVSSKLGNLGAEGKELANKAKEAGEALFDKAKEAGKDLLDKAKDAGGDLYDKAKDAGGDLYDKAKDASGDLLDKAKDASGDLLDKAKDAGEKLKDGVKDALSSVDGKSIGETLDKVSDALKELDEHLGDSTGDAIDGLVDFVNKTQDWLNGADFSKVNNVMNNLSDKFKGDGFAAGIGIQGAGDLLDGLKSIFSSK